MLWVNVRLMECDLLLLALLAELFKIFYRYDLSAAVAAGQSALPLLSAAATIVQRFL